MANAIRTGIRVLSAVAPPLAAEIGYRLWGALGTPATVHERDRAVHEAAITGVLEVGGERVVTYRWGDGPHVILLVHGWRSRASRFGSLVAALVAPDRTIVAFDAPGNGDSTGSRVTALEYAEAIRQLGEQYGGFDVTVGHSFGVLSTFVAVREGVSTRAIVDVAGMYNADQLVNEFAAQAGLAGAAKSGLRRRIERRTFPTVADPWRRFTTELDPTATHIPLLVVHDDNDAMVSPSQADLIAESHTGEVTRLSTQGLGHSRILGDPGVLATIGEFVTGVLSEPGTRTRS
jgi:pimeloyl-ACP methyl ester carboxylesterase